MWQAMHKRETINDVRAFTLCARFLQTQDFCGFFFIIAINGNLSRDCSVKYKSYRK